MNKLTQWLLLIFLFMLSGCQLNNSEVRQGNLLDIAPEWERFTWKKHGRMTFEKGVHSGSSSSYRIFTNKKNDLRFTKKIKIYAGRYYRFSAKVKTEDIKGDIGANLSVYGTYNHSQLTLEGDNDWTLVEQVFRALKDDEVEFALRLGNWNATATGDAWFDDIRLKELAEWNGAYEPIEKSSPQAKLSSAPLRVFNFLFFIPFLAAYLIILRRQQLKPYLPSSQPQWAKPRAFWFLLAIALLARLIFSAYTGFTPQLVEYKALALSLAEPFNLASFPLASNANLASPLWLYWLSIVGYIVKANMLEATAFFNVLLKLPGIVAEIGLIYLLLIHLSRFLSEKGYWWQAYFIALNPAFIMVTAFWGQPIAICALLVLSAILLAYQSRSSLAAIALAAAIACNLLSLIFAPIIGLLLLRLTSRSSLARFIVITSTTIPAFYLPLIALTGGIPQDNIAVFVSFFSQTDGFTVLIIGIFSVCLAAVLLLDRWRPIEWIGSKGIEPYFALSYFAALFAAVLLPWFKDLSLYIALVCLVPLLVQSRHYRWSFFIVSVLLLLKPVYLFSYHVLSQGGMPKDSILPYVGVGTVLFLIVLEILWRFSRSVPLSSYIDRFKEQFTDNYLDHNHAPGAIFIVNKWDYVAVAAIWLVAFSLLLFNIGELKYPTTGHTYSTANKSFELEFTSPQKLTQVRAYTGAKGGGVVRFESWTGNTWKPLWRKNSGALRYQGKKQYYSAFKVLKKSLRHLAPIERLRITISGDDFDLNELALIGADGKPILPAKIISRQGKEVALSSQGHPLFNEQDQITGQTGYQARTVWDEVTMARSANELINGIEPYEKAHPPLGKSLIGVGIQLFDMTPFGWRFMNALAVALLPVLLFIGGRWITGNRIGAYLAAVLAVFELMFFIHGRWANIDTFLVLFVTACLLALYRWYMLGQGRFARGNLSWFLLAGLLFGLAASVKWNALFVGFAVFILLVGAKVSGLTTAMIAQRSGTDDAVSLFWRRDLLPSVAYWALGFLLLPALVYYFSHFEFIHTAPGSPSVWSAEGLRTFIEQQSYAWNYHADREATHSGSSLFFTWPVMWKPMWMYTPGGLPAGMHASLNLIGNPIIWWSGFVIMLGIGWTALNGKNKVALFLAGLYFLQCLPWLLVTRTSFIYHYYPFLPLLILGIAYAASRLNYGKWLPRILLGTFLILVIVAFGLYYPLVTATPVSEDYIDSLRVFDSWSVL